MLETETNLGNEDALLGIGSSILGLEQVDNAHKLLQHGANGLVSNLKLLLGRTCQEYINEIIDAYLVE